MRYLFTGEMTEINGGDEEVEVVVIEINGGNDVGTCESGKAWEAH